MKERVKWNVNDCMDYEGGGIKVNLKKRQNPHIEALKIAVYCGILGAVGIGMFQVGLSKLVTDRDIYRPIHTYTQWSYILFSLGVIYFLVKNKITQINEVADTMCEQVAVTSQKEMEDKLYYLAYYDVLTGLPNRSNFEYKVNKKIQEYKNTDHQFAIIYMNVDNFRRINDTWGYGVGDELLCYISNIFSQYADEFLLCSHFGGNEFAIIMDRVSSKGQVKNKLKTFLKAFQTPWEYQAQNIFVTFSTGIVIYPRHGETLHLLLANSDTAMWHVKKHGKDGYSFYTTDMQTKRVNYIQTARQIKKGLKNNEFKIYYQPQINLISGKVVGMEALIRWEHPERGMIPPMEFIPLAETTGEIHAIGRFVLESVCKQKRIWEAAGYPPIVVAVNISGITLTRGDLAQEIKELLKTYKIDGAGIKVEVTETAIMADIDMAVNTLNAIRALGVKVALDDFGTGYSSLTYLQRLPIDVVKIDREFIKNIKSQDDEEIVVQIVVQIAEALNLEVIAEGVETKEQLRYLLKSNCEQAQGYFFDKPLPPEKIEAVFKPNFSYKIMNQE